MDYRAALRAVRQRQTYRNVLYLLVSLPLGLIYFLFVGWEVALGLGLLVFLLFADWEAVLGLGLTLLLLGVPILVATVPLWWRLGAFERRIAMRWLGADISPMVPPPMAGRGPLERGRQYLTSRLSWTILAYLLLKLPLGAFAFVVVAGLLALAAGLIVLPGPFLVTSGEAGAADPAVVVVTLLSIPAGIIAGVGALHAANSLAQVSGGFARTMLGSSDEAVRLARAEAVAEHAERSRRELIVNVGHELRTPTASIRGHAESLLLALEAGTLEPAELRKYLGIVHREAERLNALVDDLLALARADAGELHLELAPVAPGEVVEAVCQSLAPLARRERRVTLVCAVEPGLPRVLADRRRLEQVLLNLARNAITYTPEGGIVSIELERCASDWLAIIVADTGEGIPPEDLERVFERFYRVDASRARTSGGSGLGLAIVRDLVHAMGGSVTAHSIPGEGSSFRVLLRIKDKG